jgi:hypothetical protein
MKVKEKKKKKKKKKKSSSGGDGCSTDTDSMLSIRGLGSMQLPSSNFGHERSSLSLC